MLVLSLCSRVAAIVVVAGRLCVVWLSVPDLHASLQRQQIAVAQCVRTMQELKYVFLSHVAFRCRTAAFEQAAG
jgi:hypothetical protein